MVPLKPFESLGQHIAAQQDAQGLSELDYERQKAEFLAQAFHARRRYRRLPRWAGLALAATMSAAALALVVMSSHRALKCFEGSTAVPVPVGAWVSASNAAAVELRFSDGTQAKLWPQARGRVTRLGAHGADVVVEQGRASFQVVHRDDSRWQVNTGPFVVQVTGTRFDVEWHPENDHFELSLFEGHVRVSGCALGAGQELSAGQRVEASCGRKDFRISSLSSAVETPHELRAASTAPGAPLVERAPALNAPLAASADQKALGHAASTPAAATSPAEQWTTLARAGRFADAFTAANRVGFEAECANRGPTDTLLLADSARLSGHIEPAMQAYQVVRRRWPASAGAALAAFQMGRAEFDQRGNYRSAERWLRVYEREQPNGEFAAPALGRLMEAELRLGNDEAARGLARSYLIRYPKGPHADAANQVLGAAPAHAN